MVTCLMCGINIITQKQFFEESCNKAFIDGSSHTCNITELRELPKKRTPKKEN